MAFALFHNYYALAIMLLAMITFEGTNCYSNHQQQKNLKSVHFSLFNHEALNRSGFVIVKGVQNPKAPKNTVPFGTYFVYVNPLTVTANRSSKVVGINEGTTMTCSFDGLESIEIAKVTLRYMGYRGSLTIVGTVHSAKYSVLPITGGTEDFLFVQGYMTSTPVDLTGPTRLTYKVDFHLYWPPYASHVS